MFNHWLNLCKEAMKAQGTHLISIKWGSDESVKSLVLRKVRETRLEEPEDEIYDLEEYTRLHGDFRTNGKGFLLCFLRGGHPFAS